MDLVLHHWSQIAAAYTIYFIAVVSPGPAVMAIIASSISGGRGQASRLPLASSPVRSHGLSLPL